MSQKENSIKKKISDGLRFSHQKANDALSTGMEALNRLQNQGRSLTNSNDLLNPLYSSGDLSEKLSNQIFSNLTSSKKLFYSLSILTIIIIFFLLRWKKS